ncbi:MAG: hypothetical protein RhofKO_18540 [Rhodothermales bacterium]
MEDLTCPRTLRIRQRYTVMHKQIAFATTIALSLLLLSPRAADAQQVSVQVILPQAFQMPRTITDWQSNPDIVQFVVTNLSTEPLDGLRLSFNVTGATRGRLVTSKDQHPAQPFFSLGPAETRVFFWDDLIDEEALEFASNLETKVARDGIPEDNYLLCTSVFINNNTTLTSGESCTPLRVIEPDPPTLLAPFAELPVDPTALLFQWTPVEQQGVAYQLVVKPVFVGQDPVTAFEGNPVLMETEVMTPYYQYLPSDPPFDTFPSQNGFAWQVQSMIDGEPTGRDDGLSTIASFKLSAAALDVFDPFPLFDALSVDSLITDTTFTPDAPGPPAPNLNYTSFNMGEVTVPQRQPWQDAPPRRAQAVKLSGSASASTDVYQQTGLTRARRPGEAGLLSGQLNVQLAERITLPLSFYVSTESAGYQHPFNQIGMSPTFGWAKLHGGYFSTQFSELTLSDARLLGGGFELQPGAVRIASATGIAQRKLLPDGFGQRGLFQRLLSATQIGLGKEGGFLLWFTGMFARDIVSSLPLDVAVSDQVISPKENVVASMRMALPVIKNRLSLEGELAGSVFTDNTLTQELKIGGETELPGFIKSIFTPRLASRADFAATASLNIRPVNQFGVRFQGRLVGPGYQSLGAQQTEVDVLDLTVSPQFQFKPLTLNATVGVRENNVANTRLVTTRRGIVNANMLLRPVPWFNLSGQFSNYGLRNSEDNDTLRVENVSRQYGALPSFLFTTGKARHVLRAGYTFQEFTDENVLTGRLGDTKTHNVIGGHTLSLPSGLTFTSSATYVRGLTSSINSIILTLSESVGYAFLDRKLRVNGTFSWNRTRTIFPDYGLQGRLRLSYRLPNRSQIQASFQLRNFDYGLPRAGSDGFTEFTSRLSYSVSF